MFGEHIEIRWNTNYITRHKQSCVWRITKTNIVEMYDPKAVQSSQGAQVA